MRAPAGESVPDGAAPGPAWSYVLVALGGAVVALGALAVAATLFHEIVAPETAAWVLSAGSAVLGVGWIGGVNHGHGGYVAIVGCVAIPATTVVLYTTRDDGWSSATRATLLALALGTFAVGHALARCPATTRIAAAIAAIVVMVDVTLQKLDSPLGADFQILLVLATFVALGVVGLSLTTAVIAARRAVIRSRTSRATR